MNEKLTIGNIYKQLENLGYSVMKLYLEQN